MHSQRRDRIAAFERRTSARHKPHPCVVVANWRKEWKDESVACELEELFSQEGCKVIDVFFYGVKRMALVTLTNRRDAETLCHMLDRQWCFNRQVSAVILNTDDPLYPFNTSTTTMTSSATTIIADDSSNSNNSMEDSNSGSNDTTNDTAETTAESSNATSSSLNSSDNNNTSTTSTTTTASTGHTSSSGTDDSGTDSSTSSSATTVLSNLSSSTLSSASATTCTDGLSISAPVSIPPPPDSVTVKIESLTYGVTESDFLEECVVLKGIPKRNIWRVEFKSAVNRGGNAGFVFLANLAMCDAAMERMNGYSVFRGELVRLEKPRSVPLIHQSPFRQMKRGLLEKIDGYPSDDPCEIVMLSRKKHKKFRSRHEMFYNMRRRSRTLRSGLPFGTGSTLTTATTTTGKGSSDRRSGRLKSSKLKGKHSSHHHHHHHHKHMINHKQSESTYHHSSNRLTSHHSSLPSSTMHRDNNNDYAALLLPTPIFDSIASPAKKRSHSRMALSTTIPPTKDPLLFKKLETKDDGSPPRRVGKPTGLMDMRDPFVEIFTDEKVSTVDGRDVDSELISESRRRYRYHDYRCHCSASPADCSSIRRSLLSTDATDYPTTVERLVAELCKECPPIEGDFFSEVRAFAEFRLCAAVFGLLRDMQRKQSALASIFTRGMLNSSLKQRTGAATKCSDGSESSASAIVNDHISGGAGSSATAAGVSAHPTTSDTTMKPSLLSEILVMFASRNLCWEDARDYCVGKACLCRVAMHESMQRTERDQQSVAHYLSICEDQVRRVELRCRYTTLDARLCAKWAYWVALDLIDGLTTRYGWKLLIYEIQRCSDLLHCRRGGTDLRMNVRSEASGALRTRLDSRNVLQDTAAPTITSDAELLAELYCL